jgi:hypothetical protein
MTNFNSNLSLFTAHAGLVYQFGAETKPESERKREDSSLVEAWSIHGQSTLIGMYALPFHADYSGANSLSNGAQLRDTLSMTGYLGLKFVDGTEFYFNPEPFQGFGLSETHGVGAFPNNEAQKAAFTILTITPRGCFCAMSSALAASRRISRTAPTKSRPKWTSRGSLSLSASSRFPIFSTITPMRTTPEQAS